MQPHASGGAGRVQDTGADQGGRRQDHEGGWAPPRLGCDIACWRSRCVWDCEGMCLDMVSSHNCLCCPLIACTRHRMQVDVMFLTPHAFDPRQHLLQAQRFWLPPTQMVSRSCSWITRRVAACCSVPMWCVAILSGTGSPSHCQDGRTLTCHCCGAGSAGGAEVESWRKVSASHRGSALKKPAPHLAGKRQ